MTKHAEHGTTTMYRYGCRCERCKETKAKQRANYKARKKSGAFVPEQKKKPAPICVPLAVCMSRDFDIPQIEIGEVFGVNQATISIRLSAAGFKRGKCSNQRRAEQTKREQRIALGWLPNPDKATSYKQRAEKYNVAYDGNVTLEKVYKRDKGICYLCGCMTSREDGWYTEDGYHVCGNTYPTIDHVIPMSKGGGHTWSNVRLACRQCNSIKSDHLLTTEDMPQVG